MKVKHKSRKSWQQAFEESFALAKFHMSPEELIELLQQWETELRGVLVIKRLDRGNWGSRDRAIDDNE